MNTKVLIFKKYLEALRKWTSFFNPNKHLQYRSPVFWIILYFAGIIISGAITHWNLDDFNINTSINLFSDSEIEERGKLLIDRIENKYKTLGEYITITIPEKWNLENRNNKSYALLTYRSLSQYENDDRDTTGRLVITSSNSKKTLIQPDYAINDTETLVVDFDFNVFSTLIEKGYTEKDIGLLDCLYFSLYNITTLGNGDITPKTDFARLIVSIQILYGLIVTAFFVIALQKRIFKE